MSEMMFCSFCGKMQDEVKKLVTNGDKIAICDQCILVCLCVVLFPDKVSLEKRIKELENKVEQIMPTIK